MEDRAGLSPSTSGGGTSRTEGNESDEQSRSTPPSKRMRYSCKFRKEHRKIFPWATDSRRGRSYAYCMRCSRVICITQGGVKDLGVLHFTHDRNGRPLEPMGGDQCQKYLFLVDVQTYFVGTFFMVIFLFERHFQI